MCDVCEQMGDLWMQFSWHRGEREVDVRDGEAALGRPSHSPATEGMDYLIPIKSL